MRLALVRDGIVVNVIEADASFAAEAPMRAVPSAEAGPGWLFDGASLSPPPETRPAPASVSMFQAREAMRLSPARDGRSLLESFDAFVDARRLSEPTLAIAWEYATKVDREGVLAQTLARAFGLDEAALDDLFRLADGVRA